MKRILVLTVLPVMLFALERVNLIKDAGFERNSELWKIHAKTASGKDIDSNAVEKHDSTRIYTGGYSGSCDTRKPPSPYELDSAVIMQGFAFTKGIKDLDSLVVNYSIMPIVFDDYLYYNRLHGALIALQITDPSNPSYELAAYKYKSSDLDPTPPPWIRALDIIDFDEDTSWHTLKKALGYDLTQAGFSDESTLDSFVLVEWGFYFPPWRGQKIYWDDIRLTGYADYDVGVKGILSKDSIGKAYTPTARIKNFGRKPADSFLVVATIEGGSGSVYADTLTWSLTADTEDTVSFKEFKPSDAASYTLTVSTVMTPDESDEDDAMSKALYGTGVLEDPSPSSLQLEVEALSSIRYSLPQGEQGTISLYDPAGRRVESFRVQGEGKVSLEAGLATGVYFVKLETGKASVTKKAVVLR